MASKTSEALGEMAALPFLGEEVTEPGQGILDVLGELTDPLASRRSSTFLIHGDVPQGVTGRVTGGRRPTSPARQRTGPQHQRRRRFAAAFLVAKQLEDPPVDTKVLGEFGVEEDPGMEQDAEHPPDTT